jgi:hypothetical protein
MAKKQARAIVAAYAEWCRVSSGPELIVAASVLEVRHTLNFWEGHDRASCPTIHGVHAAVRRPAGRVHVRRPRGREPVSGL